MKKTAKGIKVCTRKINFIDGNKELRLMSAFSDGAQVEYKIGEWVSRKEGNGPLAVFKDLDSAKQFMMGLGRPISKSYFTCEYKKSKENGLYCYKKINSFLTAVFKQMYSFELPYGTVCADKVKLIEQVI